VDSDSGEVHAIVFDLDGTLADTEQLHFDTFNEVLGTDGIELTAADYFSRLIGYSDHDCFSQVLREHRRSASEARINDLIARKTALYQAAATQHEIIYPGAAEFVQHCAQRFPLALVTGTLRVEAELILRKAQLRYLFAAIVAAEDVVRGKPAPDGFKLALARLGLVHPGRSLAAAECLAIEDSPAGIDAARGAGMRVLAVAQTVAPTRLASAHLIRRSLADTDLNDVLRQLAVM